MTKYAFIGACLMISCATEAGNYTKNSLKLNSCSDFIKTEGSYWYVNLQIVLLKMIFDVQ